MTPAVSIQKLRVAYQKNIAVDGLNLDIAPGQVIGIIGPNGAGKSTVIKAILGLIPFQGSIQLHGQSINKARKLLGYVPQKEAIDWDFPVSVRDVVMMGRYGRIGLIKRPSKADHLAVDKALANVHMSQLASRQISELSGGQQQRVFLARALAQESSIYLMDEPFTGVDAKTEKAIVKVLHKLKSEGKTIIIVHHDLMSVHEYFDSVALLNKHIIAHGPTQEIFTLENLKACFGGTLNIFVPKKAPGGA